MSTLTNSQKPEHSWKNLELHSRNVKWNEELLREIAKQTLVVGDTLQRIRNTYTIKI